MRDAELLAALLATRGLTARERQAFTSMHAAGRPLSFGQRAWAQDVGGRVGVQGVGGRVGYVPPIADAERTAGPGARYRERYVRHVEREARAVDAELREHADMRRRSTGGG